MALSQSVIVLSTSCSGDEDASNDTISSLSSSSNASNQLSESLSSYLESLPLVCDILMLPEAPDKAKQAVSLSQKHLNPCGFDNLIGMQSLQTGAMLMSLNSCYAVVAPSETNDPAVLLVQPVPSTFVLNGQEVTNSANPVYKLNVTFIFQVDEQPGNDEVLKEHATNPTIATQTEEHIREFDDSKRTRKPTKNDNNDATQAGCATCKDSCDLTLEPFYQDLLRSSFQKTKSSFVSDDPEVVLKHLQVMTEKESQDLDRILKLLGVVGVFLLGLLLWSGRELFRASRKEALQVKRVQHAIQEMEEHGKKQKVSCDLASPIVVPMPTNSVLHPTKSTRRALSFATPQPKQVTSHKPACSNLPTPAPLPKEANDNSIYNPPPRVRLSQKEEDPFNVPGASPIQKIDHSNQQEHEPHVRLREEEENQSNQSDEKSSPVLLLLTTSLSINRKHVAHQARIKTLLNSNRLHQLEVVDGADPSKKVLRNALFQLSGLRAVYPQLFVSRGSKLRFVGDMEKVQRLHDERLMNEKYLFDQDDWQQLEDIVCSVPAIDQSLSAHDSSASSSFANLEDLAHLPCPSLPTSKNSSQSMASVESDSTENNNEGEDSMNSADSVSTPNQEPSSYGLDTDSIIGPESIAGDNDAAIEESIHSADSVATTNQQPILLPSEADSITSIGAGNEAIDGACESLHSAVSESALAHSATTSTASTPSRSSNGSLSPFAKMAKAWAERHAGKGKSGRPNRSKLQPLALQWNTGAVLSGESDAIGNDQDTSPVEFPSTNTENPGNRLKLTPTTKLVPQVSSVSEKGNAQEAAWESSSIAARGPPSLEVTCSTPESQENVSFIEDYWW